MSRSNPEERAVHPCRLWLQWNGEKGNFKYFDKSLGEKGENVEVPAKMLFILLDRLYTIKGWHDASESGIYSNEVRNIGKDKLLVKAFKNGTQALGEGVYKDIKDKVKAQGGKFNVNLYIAYKDAEGKLQIGSMMLQGAALNAWIEFEQEVGKEVNTKTIKITGTIEGKKGKITFKTPVFALADISPETNQQAIDLDIILQDHLKKYLSKNNTSQESTEGVDQTVKEEVFSEKSDTKGATSAKEFDDILDGTNNEDVPF